MRALRKRYAEPQERQPGSGRNSNLTPAQLLTVEQVKLPCRIVSNPNDEVDREKRRKTPDRGSQCAQHPQLRAIVAIFSVEGVADEAAIARLRSEQSHLSLELNRRSRQQWNSEDDANVTHRKARRKIVAAIDHQIMTGKQALRILLIDPLLHGRRFHEAVEPVDKLQSEIRFGIALIPLPKERLPMKIGQLHDIEIDDRQLARAGSSERRDDRAADPARANDGDLLLP